MTSDLVTILQRFEHMDCDICNLDFVLFDALAFHAVVDHDVTEWARRGDTVRAGGEQLLASLDVDVLADGLLHPKAAATCAAAHRLGTVVLGFEDLHAAERSNDLSRSEVDVVVSAEVAGVVVDNALSERRVAHVEIAVLDQLLEELTVMNDVVVATELRVFVR